jgi:hypothetical protein
MLTREDLERVWEAAVELVKAGRHRTLQEAITEARQAREGLMGGGQTVAGGPPQAQDKLRTDGDFYASPEEALADLRVREDLRDEPHRVVRLEDSAFVLRPERFAGPSSGPAGDSGTLDAWD